MNTPGSRQNKLQETGAKRLSVYILSLVFALSPALSMAQQGTGSATEELAGTVIVVQGEVIAQDANGSSRQLSRRAAIYVGDTIFTARRYAW